ncbi:MAG TPA: hypothetical protein VK779_12820, partial [Rhizomicrobium sp.]|nr:hypothetical protein [Rhizomicrobium sp.]
MKTMPLVLLPLLIASTAEAAGWKATLSPDKKCAAQVPGDWETAVTGVGMQMPADGSYARVTLDSGSMADAKGLMISMYKIKTTMADTATRYWVETGSSAGDTMRHWTVAVPGNGGTCV